MSKKVEVIKLFMKAIKKTKIDHSEWIEADNLDEIRLIAPTDHLTGEIRGVEVENEHGSVFSLSELSDDELDVFISILKDVETPKYQCSNCGGGFKREEMVFDEENENDFCIDCSN
jgi:hypothetical protein